MVVVTGLVCALVGYILVATTRTGPLLHAFLPDPGSDTWPVIVIRYCTAVPVLVTGLFIAHVFLPARRSRIADVWPGIAFTTLTWVVLGALFSIYLRR